MNWEGLLLLNKDKGKTSHDAVEHLRKILKYRAIGHTGTLDPQATGLLLICLGKALKIAQFLQNFDKEYVAEIKLGTTTDTYDVEGKVIRSQDKVDAQPDEVKRAIKSFQGEIEQTPPIYSALRYKGKRLYQYAREGKKVNIEKKRVNLKTIDNLKINLPYAQFRVVCSKGTYIRSLAFDIGEKLGCGAFLYSLCRTKIGHFTLTDSLTISEVEQLSEKEKLEEKLCSIEQGLAHLPFVLVDNNIAQQIKCGIEIKAKNLKLDKAHFEKGELLAIKDISGKVLAVGRALMSSQQMSKTEDNTKAFGYERVLA